MIAREEKGMVMYITSDGSKFALLIDAIKHELGYDDLEDVHEGEYYVSIKDAHPHLPTRMEGTIKIYVYTFYDLVLYIYRLGDKLKILKAKPQLTKEQEKFIKKVRKLAVEMKAMETLAR